MWSAQFCRIMLNAAGTGSRFCTIDSEDYKSWFPGQKNGNMSRYAVKWLTTWSGSDCTNHIANSWPRNLQSWRCHGRFQRRNFEVKYASCRVSTLPSYLCAELNMTPVGHLVPKPTTKDGPLYFSRDQATQSYSNH